MPEVATRAPADPRLGLPVDPDATSIAFDDGSQYACRDGLIVKQTRPPTREE